VGLWNIEVLNIKWVIVVYKTIRTEYSSFTGTTMAIKQTTPTILSQFNTFRAQRNLAPVKRQTFIRYVNGGSGYENGTPAVYNAFLKQYLKSNV
jgi:hypothetical protein